MPLDAVTQHEPLAIGSLPLRVVDLWIDVLRDESHATGAGCFEDSFRTYSIPMIPQNHLAQFCGDQGDEKRQIDGVCAHCSGPSSLSCGRQPDLATFLAAPQSTASCEDRLPRWVRVKPGIGRSVETSMTTELRRCIIRRQNPALQSRSPHANCSGPIKPDGG